jgi:hypothetical protein
VPIARRHDAAAEFPGIEPLHLRFHPARR